MYARELVAEFPDVAFIAGHAGLFKCRDVIDMLSPYKTATSHHNLRKERYHEKESFQTNGF